VQSLLVGASTDISNDYIEECIGRQQPLVKILRLLALQSLANDGIKPNNYDLYKRELLQTYGFDFMFTLSNLEKLGFIHRQDKKTSFPTIRKSLRLIVDDIDESNPNDIAYVYSMYAPLSIRVIESGLAGAWRGSLDPVLKLLPGPAFEESQPLPPGVQEGSMHQIEEWSPNSTPGGPSTTASTTGASAVAGGNAQKPIATLVFFLGGVTFTEISALRFLGQHSDPRRDFIIATTKLINGDSFLTGLMENLET